MILSLGYCNKRTALINMLYSVFRFTFKSHCYATGFDIDLEISHCLQKMVWSGTVPLSLVQWVFLRILVKQIFIRHLFIKVSM